MRYCGGKQRISKDISSVLNEQLKEGQPFVDLFCGACNIISKIEDNRLRITNYKHKYLISMWKALQEGWEMPDTISREEYFYIKNHKDENKPLTGFVGFGCSVMGRWMDGSTYAEDKTGRNYCLNAKNSNLKILPKIQDVIFYNLDYKDVEIPIGSLVYCDIPYKNSTQYSIKEVGKFNHDEFYQWVRDNSNIYDIYISEYKDNIPNDFQIVWEKNTKKSARQIGKDNKNRFETEVLIKYKNNI